MYGNVPAVTKLKAKLPFGGTSPESNTPRSVNVWLSADRLVKITLVPRAIEMLAGEKAKPELVSTAATETGAGVGGGGGGGAGAGVGAGAGAGVGVGRGAGVPVGALADAEAEGARVALGVGLDVVRLWLTPQAVSSKLRPALRRRRLMVPVTHGLVCCSQRGDHVCVTRSSSTTQWKFGPVLLALRSVWKDMERLRQGSLRLTLAALTVTLGALSYAAPVDASVRPSLSPTPPTTATPKPNPGGNGGGTSLPSPGTIPAGSSRLNPLPASPTAPALLTVDPWTIDPQVDTALNIFGRNLSAQTKVQVDTVPLAIINLPDPVHVIVWLPKGALGDGAHDIVLTNLDGQFDDARGALTAHSPGPPIPLYVVAAGLAAAFLLFRIGRMILG